MPNLLSFDELSEQTRIPKSAIRHLVKNGQVPVYKVNRNCQKIDASEFQQALKSTRTVGSAAAGKRPSGKAK